jgi:serine phosphatase RsbU (regulator of sigma subunit)
MAGVDDAAGWARELEVARRIQRGFLPDELPAPPGWRLAAEFEPARQVSGDFYDAFETNDGLRLALVVGDVSGKGVGAALFMALFRSFIRAVATRAMRSGQTMIGDPDSPLFAGLGLANDYIATAHAASGVFATAFAGSVDVFSGAVRYVNAGHDPAPVIVASDGSVRARLDPTGPALGMEAGARLAVGTARLHPGETLLIATDGVTEARDPAGEFFGPERLDAQCAGEPVEAGAARGAHRRGRARVRRRRGAGGRRDAARGDPRRRRDVGVPEGRPGARRGPRPLNARFASRPRPPVTMHPQHPEVPWTSA